ncbi:MAG TPA: hypothetical protein VGF99_05415 [Myxococcota bacterium]
MDAAALFTFLRDLHPAAGIVRAVLAPSQHTDRTADDTVTITCLRVGPLVGKDGAHYDELITALTQHLGHPVDVLIEEVAQPELEPQAIADDILKRVGNALDAAEASATAERLANLRTEMAIKVGAVAAHVIVDGATINDGKGIEAGSIADADAGDVVVAVAEGPVNGAVVTVTARVQRRRE